MAAIVERTGATVLHYDSVYRQADFRHVADDPLYLLSLLLDESAAMLRALDEQMPDRPDMVVYDISILYAGRILARKWECPAAQLIPVFASNAGFSYLHAIYDDPGGAEAALPRWVDGMLERIRALAGSHGVGVPAAELWWGVQDFSLVNIPRSFQFAGDTFDERFVFVGPCLGERSFLGRWEPPGNGLPVALVSFGAVFNEHPGFFRTCVQAFQDIPWHVVMTVADGVDPAALGPLPPTIEVHRWVPHLSVLGHASVAVTHGGMGTVMEALHSGCPMVVVPTSAIDRPTGRRVEELGLGRAMRPEEVTAERLVAAVLDVAADQDIGRRTRSMRQDVQAAGGTVRAADELERRLDRICATERRLAGTR
ncbi:glycosyltransferase [Sphaerisporangium flaviroseum]|uniref:Glycosyltransferase n=2 Tax=Sphaerisporangium flaviroseum TaxID=509199 RepID=A0ABP7IX31_9ACTN